MKIRAVVEPHSQADPKFQTLLAFTRITSKTVREALLTKSELRTACRGRAGRADVGHDLESDGLLPAARVEDAPSKKIRETDAIFEQVRAAHERAANDPTCLRISIDTKAMVKIGKFSRGGLGRGDEAVRDVDHDMHPDAVLAPAGILDVVSG